MAHRLSRNYKMNIVGFGASVYGIYTRHEHTCGDTIELREMFAYSALLNDFPRVNK